LNNIISTGERFAADGGSGSNLVQGEFYLSNESRFAETYYSEPLTTYLVGWRDPNNIEATLDFIAPPVQAPGRLFEFKSMKNAEEFLSETDDIRAIDADFKRVEYRGADNTAKTINKGLTIRLDLDQYPDVEMAQAEATSRIWRRLLRNELRRCVAALLTAGGTPTAKTWSGGGAVDPDGDVLNALVTATDSSGIRPNRVIYNETVWTIRQLAFRAQNVAGAYASAQLTLEALAALLAVEKCYISRERYATSATAKAKILGSYVIGFYGIDGATREDPTNLKRFWTPVQGGGKMRVYVQQVSAKLVDVSVEHYSNIISPTNLGMFVLGIS
jgi:hypothetical protein